MTCKSGALTQDGSKSSSMRTANSSTGPTARSSMLKEEKMLKDKQSVFGVTIEESINNGKLSILIRLMLLQQRALIRTSASILTDHSTSDQDFQ
jgi:hypothetical protein